jgi:hypothetical protein
MTGNTCLSPNWGVSAGSSCNVVLVAAASRLGMVRGYFIIRDTRDEIVVSAPVRVRGAQP